eukprot:CAMPEP_0196576798 /NCGR_PEP_ID=MMETSP1081-20130531/5975_1 /TAXON_ID=36882 /ORGANISM="Pyramimonas amylifera, Strain CCMP720" /LENGTH=78 /DNA_ID=CAMNT_0041895499 /DNA_START=41 /DNA_END=277 /DNA_ORIENTATION=-
MHLGAWAADSVLKTHSCLTRGSSNSCALLIETKFRRPIFIPAVVVCAQPVVEDPTCGIHFIQDEDHTYIEGKVVVMNM